MINDLCTTELMPNHHYLFLLLVTHMLILVLSQNQLATNTCDIFP